MRGFTLRGFTLRGSFVSAGARRVIGILACVLVSGFVLSKCARDGDAVVVYTSLDEVFSRPILEAFTAETGIAVSPAFDVEATKTTGLFKRLLLEHESGRPRADVFWNSEVARTLQLDAAGALAQFSPESRADLPPAYRSATTWTGFATRARIIVYNTERVSEDQRPRSIADLASERFRGRAGIALPLFGTTVTHAGALWATLGAQRAEAYFESLLANDVKILEGNSTVRDRVVSGELDVGLTDTDDAAVAIARGAPIGIVFPDQEPSVLSPDRPLGTFLIPNTVALIAGGPNPEAGKKFIEFVVSAKIEARLAAGESVQIPARPELGRGGFARVLH